MSLKFSQLRCPALAGSVLTILFAAAAPGVAAQEEAPVPSPKLKPLSRFVGNWRSSGTFSMADAQGEWSGTMRVSWILNDFVLRADSTVDIPEPQQGIGDLQVLANSWMTLDPSTDGLVSYNFGNDGKPGEVARLQWVDDDTLVGISTRQTDAGPEFRRSTWTFEQEAFTFRHEVALGSGPMRNEVTGRYEKVDSVSAWPKEVAFQWGPPVASEMGRLNKMLGEWNTSGWFVMPGAGKLDVSGVDKIRKRMGGHVVEFETTAVATGSPDEYQAFAFLEWHPETSSYWMVSFSNMGEFAQSEMTWADESTLTNFSSMSWLGQSMVARNVFKIEGEKLLMDSHSIFGMEAPMHSFHIEYVRADD